MARVRSAFSREEGGIISSPQLGQTGLTERAIYPMIHRGRSTRLDAGVKFPLRFEHPARRRRRQVAHVRLPLRAAVPVVAVS